MHMFDHDHVAAIFASRDQAEAAVEELRAAGIAEEHLGVAVHEPDVSIVLEEEEDTEAERAVARGVTIGGVMGFVAGITVVAIAATLSGGIGVGGILAGGLGVLFGGAALGGEISLAVEEPSMLTVEHLLELPLEPGQVLVVAKAHHRRALIEATFRHHDGRIVDPTMT
jgi:hypothetical protein